MSAKKYKKFQKLLKYLKSSQKRDFFAVLLLLQYIKLVADKSLTKDYRNLCVFLSTQVYKGYKKVVLAVNQIEWNDFSKIGA